MSAITFIDGPKALASSARSRQVLLLHTNRVFVFVSSWKCHMSGSLPLPWVSSAGLADRNGSAKCHLQHLEALVFTSAQDLVDSAHALEAQWKL